MKFNSIEAFRDGLDKHESGPVETHTGTEEVTGVPHTENPGTTAKVDRRQTLKLSEDEVFLSRARRELQEVDHIPAPTEEQVRGLAAKLKFSRMDKDQLIDEATDAFVAQGLEKFGTSLDTARAIARTAEEKERQKLAEKQEISRKTAEVIAAATAAKKNSGQRDIRKAA